MDSDIKKSIETFFAPYPLKRFKKGQIIIYANEAPAGIFYLKQGKVRQYDVSERGDEIVVNVFQPPAFLPMSWAINKNENLYFFETVEVVEAHIAPPEAVVEFLINNPKVMYNLLSRLYSGTDGLLRRMAHLMGGSARNRLLYEIIVECRRFGKPLSDNSYRLSVNESELAQRAGLSRETVSRELGKLKAQKLVTYDHSIIVGDIYAIEGELGAAL